MSDIRRKHLLREVIIFTVTFTAVYVLLGYLWNGEDNHSLGHEIIRGGAIGFLAALLYKWIEFKRKKKDDNK